MLQIEDMIAKKDIVNHQKILTKHAWKRELGTWIRRTWTSRAPTPAGKWGRYLASSANVLCLLFSFSSLMVSLGFSSCSLFFSFMPCSCQFVHKFVMGPPSHPFNLHLKARSGTGLVNCYLYIRSSVRVYCRFILHIRTS